MNTNKRNELTRKAMKLGEKETRYKIEEACWNGYDWTTEEGYFTINGVVRFAGLPCEIFETYDEIDIEILENCLDFAEEE